MKRKKLHEVELNRYFKNVHTFWAYALKMCEKHGVNLTDWMESLDQFCEPMQRNNSRNNHEICKMLPYDWQLYLQNSYNFIMEFDFFDEKSGHGYLYIVEYDTANS